MTTRTVTGGTFTLGYDAEGHLASVSGPSMSASFTYDGEGQRVKSTLNSVTTTFPSTGSGQAWATTTKFQGAR